MNKYAGVGSRTTPKDILQEMIKISNYLTSQGWVLRSGGADGADDYFERGTDLYTNTEFKKRS